MILTWYPLSSKTQAVTKPVTPPPTTKILGDNGDGARSGEASGERSLQNTRLFFKKFDILKLSDRSNGWLKYRLLRKKGPEDFVQLESELILVFGMVLRIL